MSRPAAGESVYHLQPGAVRLLHQRAMRVVAVLGISSGR
jgi:hypothetical protein